MNDKIVYIASMMIMVWGTMYPNADDMFKKEGAIILECSVIKISDGSSLGIDGEEILRMMRVRKEVRKIQLGVPNTEGNFIGLYHLNNTDYSVKELAALETEMRENDPAALVSLKPLLKKAKEDFVKHVMSFMNAARGAKPMMLLLIQESCNKRKRYDSVLLRWGAAREGTEERQFDGDITDFRVFDTFCTDLIHFLQDVMRSCPKAWAQFQHMVAQQKSGGH